MGTGEVKCFIWDVYSSDDKYKIDEGRRIATDNKVEDALASLLSWRIMVIFFYGKDSIAARKAELNSVLVTIL